MYEKKGKIKKISILFVIISIITCSIMPLFTNINQVQAKITTGLPISQMRDDFPASYVPYINALKQAHPNWVFKAVYTGLDWNEAVSHESYEVNTGISAVPSSYDPAWKKDGQDYQIDDGGWVIASIPAVKYMLDPRNHINEKEVFQFQTLSYSKSMDTIDSIEKVLYGTSMYNRSEYQKQGSMINMNKTYSSIILDAAKQYNVSGVYIASRIKQETGGNITSNRSINGSTVIDGVVPYNYFNIGATPPDSITNGLKYAKNKNWTDPDSAIKGGTDILKNQWIKWGQDTTYFQKFDVNNPYGNAIALYAYQYMTNILAPTNESYSTYTAYEKMGMLNNVFEFHIPVFNNMPDSLSPYPGNNSEEYVSDNTRIAAYDVAPSKLYIRSGPGTTYSIVAKLDEGDQMTRIAKSLNTQWDKVRLDNGIEGYVFRDYTKEVDTNVKVTGISLNTTNLEMNLGDTYDLTCTILPNNATNKDVEWSSSNGDIVSVENGKLTAKSKGEATITVKSLDNEMTATCKVNVVKKVTKITLDDTELTLNKGENKELTYKIEPEDATNKNVEWSSSDSSIVSVENGKITANKSGNATITVKAIDTGLTSTCNVTVISKVENITIPKENYTMIKGKYLTIVPTISPDDATNKEYSVTSKNENIVKIENNKIKGVNSGSTDVVFKTKDGEKSVTAKVKVIDISEADFLTFDKEINVNDKENIISKIEPNTKISELLNKLTYNKEKYEVVIKDINNKIILDNDLVGTGTTIELTDKESKDVIQSYSVVIYGDINGEGLINTIDLQIMQKAILKIKALSNIQKLSSDIKKDGGEPTTIDLQKLQKHILNINKIVQE